MGQNKTQSSLEYILVVALTFAIIVPTTYLLYSYSKESTQEIKDSQIAQIGKTIVDAAEAIFYSGEGSKTEIEVDIPDNINKVEIIDGRELVFSVRTDFGDSDIVFFSSSSIPLTTKKIETCCIDTCELCSETICKLFGLELSGLKKVKINAIRNPDNENAVKIEVVC